MRRAGAYYGTVSTSDLNEADLDVSGWVQPARVIQLLTEAAGRPVTEQDAVKIVMTGDDTEWLNVWIYLDLEDEPLASTQEA
jgi:hypothetical protein